MKIKGENQGRALFISIAVPDVALFDSREYYFIAFPGHPSISFRKCPNIPIHCL